jgi:hypothetical protein
LCYDGNNLPNNVDAENAQLITSKGVNKRVTTHMTKEQFDDFEKDTNKKTYPFTTNDFKKELIQIATDELMSAKNKISALEKDRTSIEAYMNELNPLTRNDPNMGQASLIGLTFAKMSRQDRVEGNNDVAHSTSSEQFGQQPQEWAYGL